MKQFKPTDAMYDILCNFLKQAQHKERTQKAAAPVSGPCPFCETNCGRGIRACAESSGGRKALKDLIRDLAVRLDRDDNEALNARSQALYLEYQNVSLLRS